MTVFSSEFRVRASWLHERAEATWVVAPDGDGLTPDRQRRLARWRTLVAGANGPEDFARRLAWDGWTDRAASMVSSHGHWVESDRPRWLEILETIVTGEDLPVRTPAPTAADTVRRDELPFEELFHRPLAVARQALARRMSGGEIQGLLSSHALQRLERQLLKELSHLCTDSLFAEFGRFRPAGHELLARMNVPPPAAPGRIWYDPFVASIGADRLRGYFERHPVIARLCAELIDTWADALGEFVERLSGDRVAIAAMAGFAPDAAGGPGEVVDVWPGLSDRHHGGRTVMVLQFKSGHRVVYKPRPLAMEAAWQQMLEWCNGTGDLSADLRAVAVLDRGAYGWMAFVAHQPCNDEPAVRRFYVRAGELLCLLHVLRATDGHLENLIAAGEHPVFVDAETLLQPGMRPFIDSTPASGSAYDVYQGSVLRTGLLPRWEYDDHLRRAIDVSALAGGLSGELHRVVEWVAVNSDAMRCEVRPRLDRPQNLPSLAGVAIDSGAYVDALVAGFDAMYALLERRREMLAGEESALRGFAGHPTRFIVRLTQLYHDAQARAVATSDGAEAGIELDALVRPYAQLTRRPPVWTTIAAERSALLRLDVPYFRMTTDGVDLLFDGGRVDGFFLRSGLEEALAVVRGLGDGDRRMQTGFIRSAFQARAARADGARPSGGPLSIDAGPPLTREAAVAAAEAIARDIAARAILGADGSANWIGLSEDGTRYQLGPLQARLYDGVTGVALFLAAVDACTGTTAYRELADAALVPLRRLIQGPPDRARRATASIPIGAATGIGSLAYTLALIATLRRDAAMLDDAVRAAGWIDAERIRLDRQLDVVGGAAGAVMALLAVHQIAGEPGVLTAARQCGEHLLAHRSDGGRHRAWRTFGSAPLGGFSHGAAGIADALGRLAGATGDQRFADAAADAVAYERTLFSSTRRNWADLRSAEAGGEPSFQAGWCHGAAGIGLSRLGLMAMGDDPALRADLTIALDTTRGWDMREVDHLCCGEGGRLELLFESGRQLGDAALVADASRGAANLVARASAEAGYTLFPEVVGRVASVGFFQGLAGIGYMYLRLHHATDLASVLRFTPPLRH